MIGVTGPTAWRAPEIGLEVHGELPDGLDAPAVVGTLREAAGAWMSLECSTPRLDIAEGTVDAPAAPGDGRNTVQWVFAGWEGERNFPYDAAAVTDVQYESGEDGAFGIVEADLYLNAEFFQWSPSDTPETERDLLAVATHELGHVIGLLHPCESVPVDGAPRCDTDPSYAGRVMYPLYRGPAASLEEDDVGGACYLYPTAECAEICESACSNRREAVRCNCTSLATCDGGAYDGPAEPDPEPDAGRRLRPAARWATRARTTSIARRGCARAASAVARARRTTSAARGDATRSSTSAWAQGLARWANPAAAPTTARAASASPAGRPSRSARGRAARRKTRSARRRGRARPYRETTCACLSARALRAAAAAP